MAGNKAQFQFVFFGQSKEKVIDGVALSGDVGQLIHGMAEGGRSGQPTSIPGNVLARHAHAGIDAVKGIQILKVGEQTH